jgi:DNA-binding winged helix-turn-helix (wHTH) protein
MKTALNGSVERVSLGSMVITSKRFGPREWFVIHHAGTPAQDLGEGGDTLPGLRAPLVVPVVVVTANEQERDRIVRDLAAHIAVLQRPGGSSGGVQIGELWVDKHAHRVQVSGQEVSLTSLEFRLLVALVERRERVLSRAALLTDVWGISAQNRTRTIDTHVKRLRDKLGSAGRFVQSVRGVGYRFSEAPVAVSRAAVPPQRVLPYAQPLAPAASAG